LKRQLSAPRFRLKGKGWYETDFKSDKQRNLHGEKDAAKQDDKPASSTTDTKSDTSGPKKESAPAPKPSSD
jgi:predicted nucleic acid-binding Zn ribbon protein